MDNYFKYQRAVHVQNHKKVVYAFFHAAPDEFIEPNNDGRFFLGPIWIVWFPETIEYTSMSQGEFNEKYTLEENLPRAIRVKVSQFPTYDEWVAALREKDAHIVQ